MFLSRNRNIPLVPSPPRPMLRRRLTSLQAVSLNMSMMVGIGPFITIPLLLQALNGPIATVGWVLGAIVAICDGLVWSELAAAFPGRAEPTTSSTPFTARAGSAGRSSSSSSGSSW
jgi:hypothetical protein